MSQASRCLSCPPGHGLEVLVPHLAGVIVEGAEPVGGLLCIRARAQAGEVPCPARDRISRRVHSRYERRLADVPAGGRRVVIWLQVRRLSCNVPACAERTFAWQGAGWPGTWACRRAGRCCCGWSWPSRPGGEHHTGLQLADPWHARSPGARVPGYGEEEFPGAAACRRGGDVRDDGRRARIVAAVTEKDTAAGAGELIARLCRFAVDEMALSGCALVLMSGAESTSMLAGAGRHASTVTGLQMELGEGPCLQARASGIPVFLPDLAAGEANRWPAFAAAALAVGVHAEFSLPLTAAPGGIGTLDLCRDRPGMLSEEHLADALVTADIARDAVLHQQYTPGGGGVAELLDMGADRIVIHQATGMIAAQLNDTTSNALARLRAAAFASGRPMYDIAQDVVERRMRFDD